MEPIIRFEGRLKEDSLMEKLGKTRLSSQAQEATQQPDGPKRPDVDTYEPEMERVPSGQYRVREEKDGRKNIYFDDLDRAEEADPQKENADRSEKAEGSKKSPSAEKSESCTANTDQVDREIKRLKQKEAEIEKKLGAEKDEARKKQLAKELANVKRELQMKDNDAYRRRHTVFH